MKRWLHRAAVVLAALAILVLAARLVLTTYADRRRVAAREAFESTVGPLDPKVFVLPDLADEENAASWILRAAAIHEDMPWNSCLGRLSGTPAERWGADDVQLVRQATAERADVLALLARAGSAVSSTFSIPYEDGFSAEIPDLLAIVRLAKLVSLEARQAVLEDSSERFLQSAANLQTMAASLCSESTLVTLLIGSAVDRLGFVLRLVPGLG